MKKKKQNIMSIQSYKATISQDGVEDNPTVNEIVNDGFDGNWVRESAGVYHKQTTIDAGENKSVWIAGTAMSSGGSTVFPVYNFGETPVGFYAVQYGWANLKLRLTVRVFTPPDFDSADISTILPVYNEIFLPEIILKTA